MIWRRWSELSWWQIADARLRNAERSGAARTLTILLAPVGLAIYLFQTRRPLHAAAALAGFLAGIVLSLLAGDVLGMALFSNP